MLINTFTSIGTQLCFLLLHFKWLLLNNYTYISAFQWLYATRASWSLFWLSLSLSLSVTFTDTADSIWVSFLHLSFWSLFVFGLKLCEPSIFKRDNPMWRWILLCLANKGNQIGQAKCKPCSSVLLALHIWLKGPHLVYCPKQLTYFWSKIAFFKLRLQIGLNKAFVRTQKRHLTMIQLLLKWLTFHNLIYLLPSLIKLNPKKRNQTQTFPTHPFINFPPTNPTLIESPNFYQTNQLLQPFH